MSIRINNLRKSFGPVVAVDRLSLDIAQGHMLVLLGPSGCGKTTTMRCIAGLDRPDDGTISIGGKTVFDAPTVNVPANQRNVGMVFQSYAIWPHMTVFENVAFPLRVKHLDRRETETRVHEILAQVGLDELAKRGASYLSGGQMQRVALARSLVMQPSVLLFDEPLSNLDARLRDRLRIQLRELQTQFKITSVYVTHDQQEALALADQIAVMHHGELLQLADPVSIYSAPVSSTVADFIGYSNIFLAGEVVVKNNQNHVNLVSGAITIIASGVAPSGSREIFACIRPEDIRIRHADDPLAATSAKDLNTFSGDVTLASFMGSFMQYRVRADGGDTFEITSSEILRDIKIGDRVRLSISPESIRLLPSSER
ncbi:MAG: ABC transporter ATP-binding protein [Xanthobacteraceae bacterium]